MKPTFALKDNKPVHISDVERGLACGCVCSACGCQLQARKGPKNRDHFSHHKGSECSLETVIHHTAKKIIMDASEIYIPETTYKYKKIIDYNSPGQVIPLSSIHEETHMGDIKPDIIGYYKDKPLLIEVYVTHKVDEKKIKKINDKNISAIELDLSGIDYDTDFNELKRLVLYETSNREWINNERVNVFQSRLLALLEYKQTFRCTFNRIVEKTPLERVTWFVVECPIKRRVVDGYSYAKFTDCRNCNYRYGDNYPSGRVPCMGKIKSE